MIPYPGLPPPDTATGAAGAPSARPLPGAGAPASAVDFLLPGAEAGSARPAGRGNGAPPGGKALPVDLPPPWLPVALPAPPVRAHSAAPAGPAPADREAGLVSMPPGRGPQVPLELPARELPAALAQRPTRILAATDRAADAKPPPFAAGEEGGEARPTVPGAPVRSPEPPLPVGTRPSATPIPIDDPLPDPLSRPAPPAYSPRPASPSPAPAPGVYTRDALPSAQAPSPPDIAVTEGTAPAADSAENPDLPLQQPDNRPPAQLPTGPAPPVLPAAREPAPVAVMQLASPVGGEPFPQALGERVAWMIDREVGTAQLRLNPPQLGPVEVRVQVSGDQASVSFAAHNLAARDALEQAMPRLREMLGAQGFVHVDVNVSQHSFSERPPRAHAWEAAPSLAGPTLETGPAAPAPARARSIPALLDAYA